MGDALAIGVDLGATKIATALVTRAGNVSASRQAPTLAAEGFERVCERIAGEVRALLAAAPDAGEVLGVGIGSAGLVDGDAGVVRWAVNLGWRDVPLAPQVARHLGGGGGGGVRVFADNDANANALGEGFFGSARGCRHYALDPDHGLPCPCGHRGCAETIVSGPSLVAATRALLAAGSHPSALHDGGDLTAGRIVAAARAGDAAAIAAMERMSRALGEVAALAAAVLGPEVIILGGGLGAAATDLLEPGVTREMARRLPLPQRPPPVRAATLATPAVGAACIVWARMRS